MALRWHNLKPLHLRLVRIEEKLDELIQLERGLIPLIPVSNDPTEVEFTLDRFRRPTKRRILHSWVKVIEDEEVQLQCIDCKIFAADCGATTDSWYCE